MSSTFAPSVVVKATATREGRTSEPTEYETGLYAYINSAPTDGFVVDIDGSTVTGKTVKGVFTPSDEDLKAVGNHLAKIRRANPAVTITGPVVKAGEVLDRDGHLGYVVSVKAGKITRTRTPKA